MTDKLPFAKRGIDVTIWPQAKIVQPERISIGSHVIIDDFCFIIGGKKTEIGDYVHVASYASSTGGGELFIGDFCSVAQGVCFLTGTDCYTGDWGGLPNPTIPPEFRQPRRSFIRMEKHAMVGQGSRIFPGVTLGEGCAVGAMSLVLKDLPPWTVCMGIPARPVKDRPREMILRLEKELRARESGRPMVTVMIMAFNQAAFVRDAIEGALMQITSFPVEIIVHDDASTDGTAGIVREYEGKFPGIVRGIYQEENLFSKTGVYPTIRVFEEARGKYIAECDADDYWTDPWKLHRQVDFLEENPKYVMTHHAYEVEENGRRRPPDKRPPTDFTRDELIAFRIDGYGIGSCTKLYRNVYGPQTRRDFERLAGDYPMNVLLGMHGAAKFLPWISPSIYRRLNGSNSWCSLPEDVKAEKTRQMYREIYDYMVERGDAHAAELRKAFLR